MTIQYDLYKNGETLPMQKQVKTFYESLDDVVERNAKFNPRAEITKDNDTVTLLYNGKKAVYYEGK